MKIFQLAVLSLIAVVVVSTPALAAGGIGGGVFVGGEGAILPQLVLDLNIVRASAAIMFSDQGFGSILGGDVFLPLTLTPIVTLGIGGGMGIIYAQSGSTSLFMFPSLRGSARVMATMGAMVMYVQGTYHYFLDLSGGNIAWSAGVMLAI